jgi:hypothetical protein
MRLTLALLTAVLLAPLAGFAQAKPEVANAAKAAKRCWESAPAENKTMFCVWSIGHGGHAGPMARSDDAGLTWTRMDDALPPNFVNFRNCPSLYRIIDPQGKERLWVFAARTLTDKENPKLIEGRHQGFMPRIVSEDEGKTWRELPPIGGRIAKDDPFRCIMTFSSILQLKDGSSMGLFHRSSGIGEEGTLQVLRSITRDGGFTWSPPVVDCDGTKLDGKHPCEPYVFRSPDGEELCCLMRENRRSGTSLVMFSRDEGQTWSQAVDAQWGLTGDRHHGIRLPDGRLVIVFRSASPKSKDKGGFIAWVGTCDDIRQGQPGQYRVSLLKTFKDGFYPGIHLLPDGTIVATTYANLIATENPSIVSVRFRMSEVDALAKKIPLTSTVAAPKPKPDQSAGINPDGPGPLKAYDPRPWIDPDGKLWVFFTLPYPLHKHAWAITAEDGDQESPVWSPPRPVFEGVLLNKPTVLANGDWLFPTCTRRPENIGAILSQVSRDRGRTFAVKAQVEASWGLFPSEPMAVERKDGMLWMLVRTARGIGESLSTDGGATWSPLKTPAIPHTPSRFFIGRLQSGNLLLVKHLGIGEDPLSGGNPKQRRDLTAFISKDDGKTWSGGLVIDDRVGCSYPDVQQVADGTIYFCWDYQRSREQELWMTTFREEDVLAASAEATARVKSIRSLISKGGTPE